GRTSAPASPLAVGAMTATVGMAVSAATCFSSFVALIRDATPSATMMIATTAAPMPTRFSVRLSGPAGGTSFAIEGLWGSDMAWLHFRKSGFLSMPAMDQRKDGWDEEKGGDSGAEQAADDGAAK